MRQNRQSGRQQVACACSERFASRAAFLSRAVHLAIAVAIALLAIGAWGCADDVRHEEAVGAQSQAIVGGDIEHFSADVLAVPVARISYKDGDGLGHKCSGTLISRKQLLTAAHCACDLKYGFVLSKANYDEVYFPSLGGVETYAGVDSVAVHPIAEQACGVGVSRRDHDLAILTLHDPISEAVVPALPRIAFGNLAEQQDKLILSEGGWIVGYGRSSGYSCDPEDWDPSDDLRRKGYTYSWPVWDTCGLNDIQPAECQPHMVWQVSDAVPHAFPGKGDSGGPFYKQHKDFGWVLAGVDSGYVGLYGYANKCLWFRWTPTGATGGSPSNQNWILAQMGGDGDGDLVPDSLDNCPPSRCPDDPVACANPMQEDDDLDLVGDICDNCKPDEDCADQPAYKCKNPEQHDIDGDKLGDACDLCPALDVVTGDEDGDGVGDACDACPGAPEFIATRLLQLGL